MVAAVATDWREAGLPAVNVALCPYAEKLSPAPLDMTAAATKALPHQGFSDRATLDAPQVISYFNYINRIPDALPLGPEGFVRPGETLPHKR